jgi:hypothetical protein
MIKIYLLILFISFIIFYEIKENILIELENKQKNKDLNKILESKEYNNSESEDE